MDYHGLSWIIMDYYGLLWMNGSNSIARSNWAMAKCIWWQQLFDPKPCTVRPTASCFQKARCIKLKKIGPMAGQQIFEAFTSFSQVFQCAKFPFVSFSKTIHDLGDDLALDL